MHQFTRDEWQKLSTFGLKPWQERDARWSTDASHLLNSQHALEILESICPELGAPTLAVTASLVIKRSAFLLLAPTLYAMSVFNKGINGHIENCSFEYQLQHRLWRSGLPILETAIFPLQGCRRQWREALLKQVLAHHLTPLVTHFHRLTGISTRILWENVAVRVFSIYERCILPAVDGHDRDQAEADFAFIVDAHNHTIFGLEENPLTRFYRPKRQYIEHAEPVRMRRTCCYYYQATQPAEYCSTCPLLLKKKPKG